MSFTNSGGLFDRKPKRDLWDTPASRNEPGSLFKRKDPFFDLRPIVLIIPQKHSRGSGTILKNGIQPTDMRSEFQKSLDNHPVRGRSSQSKVITSISKPSVQNYQAYLDAFSIMNSCADVAIFKAELGARFMKLNPIKVLGAAGKVTGVAGLILSGYEAWNNPTWSNIGKAAAGGGIVILGIWGGAAWVPVVIIGNIGLIGYDVGKALYEHIQEAQ